MSRVAFTLIELLIVVILIGLVSFLLLTQKNIQTSGIKVEDLRDFLKNGEFFLFEDGSNLVVKDRNFSIEIKILTPVVYVYKNGEFVKKDFAYLNNKKIVFHYKVTRGIGDFFILKANDYFYVFKPLIIKKFKSFEKAKNFYLLLDYQKEVY